MSNRVNLLIPALVSASTAAPVLTPMRGAKNQNVVLDPDELNLAAVRRSIKCVLLSDDHLFCVLVRSYLQHLGFCVFTCSSSDRAEQQFLDRRDIDLWVVDIEALGVDAMCLAARVRDLHAELPIVVISGVGQESAAASPFPWHEWIRIRKPIQLPDLLAVIQRALAKFPVTSQLAAGPSGCDPEFLENDWISRLRQNHLMN
jgi:two-component system, chemotaxis family, chemotaxis protein CheY